MADWISIDGSELFKVASSTFLIFSLLILVVRFSGLRSFAKMTAIDFASTIAIGSILAATILNDSPSVLKGGAAIAVVLIFQTYFSKLLLKVDWFEKLVVNKPILLMKGDKILTDNLHRANMTEEHLMAKLREANVLQFSQVHHVVLETTGDVSVLHSQDDLKVDEKILLGVETDSNK